MYCILRGQFRVRDISLEYRGLCSVRHSDPVTQSPPETRHGQYDRGGGGGGGYDNSMPQIRNPVDKLNVTAGELLQFQVRDTLILLTYLSAIPIPTQ